jgi:hypothetical protein
MPAHSNRIPGTGPPGMQASAESESLIRDINQSEIVKYFTNFSCADQANRVSIFGHQTKHRIRGLVMSDLCRAFFAVEKAIDGDYWF